MKHKSLSMPYMIEGTYEPSWAKTENGNIEYLSSLDRYLKRQIGSIKVGAEEFALMCVKLDDIIDIYYIAAEGLIQYFVKVEKYFILGVPLLKAVGQVSVWRNKIFPMPGVAIAVFESVLYSKYSNVLSDAVQSNDGYNFWVHRVEDALKKGRLVYALGLTGTNILECHETVKLTSVLQMRHYYTDGKDESGEYWRFLITKIKLAEKKS